MELIKTIALLCQISAGSGDTHWAGMYKLVGDYQLKCHQYYVHCVSTKRSNVLVDLALERCILEKK